MFMLVCTHLGVIFMLNMTIKIENRKIKYPAHDISIDRISVDVRATILFNDTHPLSQSEILLSYLSAYYDNSW